MCAIYTIQTQPTQPDRLPQKPIDAIEQILFHLVIHQCSSVIVTFISIINNEVNKKAMFLPYSKKGTVAAGFEPTRAGPSGFQVHLLNHSDKRPALITFYFYIYNF